MTMFQAIPKNEERMYKFKASQVTNLSFSPFLILFILYKQLS